MTAKPTYEELKQRIDELEKDMVYFKFIEADRQKSEGILEAVFAANPDPIIVYDEKRHARHMNPEFSQVFGWSLDELTGHRIPFTPKDQQEKSDLEFKKLYDTEKPVKFESKRLTKDGVLLDVLISASIIKDDRGGIIGVVANLTDISKKNSTDAQFRQAHKLESINTLIGGLSNEFNNLLYIIYGNTELLMDNARPEDKNKLNEIFNSTQKGMNLIKQLLAFTHHSVSNFQEINLNIEINRISKILDHSIPKMVEIKKDLVDNIYTLNGDQGQIEQILLNLCLNAVDAMPDGGKLTIKTENCIIDDSFCAEHPEIDYPEIAKGWYAKLSVSDTGHGMDNETLMRIFDPFFTTKKEGKRTGLGLSVIYGIIQSHNGLILCDSKPGIGTTFAIYLPALKDIKRSDVPPPAHAPDLSPDEQTILIVDDEQSVVGLIQKMVSSLGYKTITVNSGENALNEYYAKKDQIYLILLDLSMPGMGGEICLKKLVEFDPDVKVVIASGFFEKMHVQNMIHYGAKDYITKPFSKSELAKIIQKNLN